jgi:hypothetical protein
MSLIRCPDCGHEISDKAFTCPQCGRPMRQQMMLGGYEYRSETTLFGLPLVHIASGFDPETGRKRIAKGIIAIGDMAVGVLAIGGGAFGGLAIGGGAIGLIALGGGAIGLLLALGGGAIGGVAVGGGAFGYYAFGGGAFGAHPLGGNAQDPEAMRFFAEWFGDWVWQMRR